MVEVSPGVVETIRGLPCPSWMEVLGDSKNERSWYIFPQPPVLRRGRVPNTNQWDSYYYDYSDSYEEKVCDTRVSAVLEPLKVRLITKGESLSYWLSKFFQKSLWNHLQKFEQFALTGKPLDASLLHGILEREGRLGIKTKLNKWVSGDYKGATDTLDIRMTHLFFETALSRSNLSVEEEEALRSVITKQRISYPPKYVKKAPEALSPFLQQNGQLMGSTLSFPILCMVNLTAYWASMEEYLGRQLPVKDLPCLINGDDILFRSNDEHYEIWKKWVEIVGFTLSMGKNYIHHNVLTVNSEVFKFNSEDESFTKVKSLNCGLLTGVNKITGKSYEKDIPIWDIYNRTVHLSCDPIRTHNRFMHYHRAEIERLTLGYDPTSESIRPGKLNIFLPRELGGLGFKPPLGLEYTITKRQTTYGHYCMERRRQAVVENKLPQRLGVALIQDTLEAMEAAPTKQRTTSLTLWPATTPLYKGLGPLEDYTVKLPPLARAYSVNDDSMKIVRPSRKHQKGAFEGKWRRLHLKGKLKSNVLLNYDRKFFEYRRPLDAEKHYPEKQDSDYLDGLDFDIEGFLAGA
jgi:hypothetical protein